MFSQSSVGSFCFSAISRARVCQRSLMLLKVKGRLLINLKVKRSPPKYFQVSEVLWEITEGSLHANEVEQCGIWNVHYRPKRWDQCNLASASTGGSGCTTRRRFTECGYVTQDHSSLSTFSTHHLSYFSRSTGILAQMSQRDSIDRTLW